MPFNLRRVNMYIPITEYDYVNVYYILHFISLLPSNLTFIFILNAINFYQRLLKYTEKKKFKNYIPKYTQSLPFVRSKKPGLDFGVTHKTTAQTKILVKMLLRFRHTQDVKTRNTSICKYTKICKYWNKKYLNNFYLYLL